MFLAGGFRICYLEEIIICELEEIGKKHRKRIGMPIFEVFELGLEQHRHYGANKNS
jgi:hypothetical protein